MGRTEIDPARKALSDFDNNLPRTSTNGRAPAGSSARGTRRMEVMAADLAKARAAYLRSADPTWRLAVLGRMAQVHLVVQTSESPGAMAVHGPVNSFSIKAFSA
jgi:hypothetical protein